MPRSAVPHAFLAVPHRVPGRSGPFGVRGRRGSVRPILLHCTLLVPAAHPQSSRASPGDCGPPGEDSQQAAVRAADTCAAARPRQPQTAGRRRAELPIYRPIPGRSRTGRRRVRTAGRRSGVSDESAVSAWPQMHVCQLAADTEPTRPTFPTRRRAAQTHRLAGRCSGHRPPGVPEG